MSNIIAVAEKEIIRNEILKMCQETMPAGASIQVLRAGLKKLGMDVSLAEVERQVSYLEGKQLVKVAELKNERLGIGRKIAYITSMGTDLLEGNLEGTGIACD